MEDRAWSSIMERIERSTSAVPVAVPSLAFPGETGHGTQQPCLINKRRQRLDLLFRFQLEAIHGIHNVYVFEYC